MVSPDPYYQSEISYFDKTSRGNSLLAEEEGTSLILKGQYYRVEGEGSFVEVVVDVVEIAFGVAE